MKNRNAYVHPSGSLCIPVPNWKVIIICLSLLFITTGNAYSQSEDTYDEINVVLNVQRIGSVEIPAIIHNQEAYLPVKDIFDFLKIKNSIAENMDSVSGFFINPQARFLVDHANSRIIYGGKTITLEKTDLIRTDNNLYLKADYFGTVFGLECSFNFRNLSVTLTTKIELPAIREMQQELMRKNISRLRGEKKADTVIDRHYPLFHIGMADWSVMNTLQQDGKPNTTLGLALGGILAGGEADLYLNYNSNQPFNEKQQYYKWKYVNNNNSLLRQVTVGKIFPQSIASIFTSVTGAQITNTPTTYRRSFGTYNLSGNTEAGWIVEMYINDVLVNYLKADASGFYSFEVPLIYGSSLVKLRFYGPWGEERTSEKYINIPFNFLPAQQLEYSITGGIVDDDQKSRFGKANVNYGLSKRITVGGGMEYLSSVTSGKFIPYVTASVRLGAGMMLSGERTHGVRSVGILSYRIPNSLQLDVNYTKYDEGQTAVKNNYLEEKKAVISMPFRSKKIAAFTRLTLDQITLLKSKFTNAELLLSGMMGSISSNLTTYAIVSEKNPLIYSSLSMSFRLPAKIRFTPQVQYEYRQKNFSMIRGEIEKSLFNKGFFNFTYEKNLVTNIQTFGLGLRYNFSFAQTLFSAIQSNHASSLIQSARGSLVYDQDTKYLGVNTQNNVGRGGLLILPYLDLNANGERDENEPRVSGLNIRINGGHIERNDKDTTIRVIGLEAYNSYFLELDKNSFDNIAWQIKNKTIRVTIDPNQLKLIEVPVTVMGEVSGSVYIRNENGQAGEGRIIVNIYNSRSKLVAKVLSESDGYFSFVGLAPGKYTAAVDDTQLQKLKMGCTPKNEKFTIKATKEGDVVDNIQFVLKNN